MVNTNQMLYIGYLFETKAKVRLQCIVKPRFTMYLVESKRVCILIFRPFIDIHA